MPYLSLSEPVCVSGTSHVCRDLRGDSEFNYNWSRLLAVAAPWSLVFVARLRYTYVDIAYRRGCVRLVLQMAKLTFRQDTLHRLTAEMIGYSATNLIVDVMIVMNYEFNQMKPCTLPENAFRFRSTKYLDTECGCLYV